MNDIVIPVPKGQTREEFAAAILDGVKGLESDIDAAERELDAARTKLDAVLEAIESATWTDGI